MDEQQINLTRFNLLFPEKRPFFLENRGLFAVGRPRRGRSVLQPPHRHRRRAARSSRSRAARGSPARRSGLNVGLLNMQTDAASAQHAGEQLHRRARQQGPAEPFEPRRHLRQPHGHRHRAPATTTGTAPTASTASCGIQRSGDLQRVCGAHRRRPALERPRPRLQLRHSSSGRASTRRRSATPRSARTSIPRWASSSGPTATGRSAPRSAGTCARRGWPSSASASCEPHASYESYWGFDGLQETATLHIDSRWDFENGYQLDVRGVERSVRRSARALRGLSGRRRARRRLSRARTSSGRPTPIDASGSRPA